MERVGVQRDLVCKSDAGGVKVVGGHCGDTWGCMGLCGAALL